jgi:hypothetical protein
MSAIGPGGPPQTGGPDVLSLHCRGGRLHRSHRVRMPADRVHAAIAERPLLEVLPRTTLHVIGHRVTVGAVRLATQHLPGAESRSTLITNLAADFVLTVNVDKLCDDRFLVYAHVGRGEEEETAEALCLPGGTVDAGELVVRRALRQVPAECRSESQVRLSDLSTEELYVVVSLVGA